MYGHLYTDVARTIARDRIADAQERRLARTLLAERRRQRRQAWRTRLAHLLHRRPRPVPHPRPAPRSTPATDRPWAA